MAGRKYLPDMGARWSTFAVGLALILAPLVLGYDALGPVLHEVALGLFVCVATLAALERCWWCWRRFRACGSRRCEARRAYRLECRREPNRGGAPSDR